MDEAKAQLFQRLQALRTDYINDYPHRILELSLSWAEFNKNKSDIDILETFHRQAHSLRGSGATFGFNEVSTLAAQLDAILTSLANNKQEPEIHEEKQITVLIEQLGAVNLHIEMQGNQPLLGLAPNNTHDSDATTNLLIIMSDKNETDDIDHHLSSFDYKIALIHSLDNLHDNITDLEPTAIIMEADFNGKHHSGIHAIADLKRSDQIKIPPIIYISGNDDISTRLNAVRNNGSHFFVRPFNAIDLSDTLENVFQNDSDTPFRIMIVEDTKSLSNFYDVTLQSVGMKTCIINDPMLVLEQLIEFNPELILMDMYMPNCSGPELAAVIRQLEAYVSIPIVFLSSEMDTAKQLSAMQQGGDDFLTKPIEPNHLITAVKTRSLRYRQLRSLMIRDSLTGLFNHTKTEELLEKDLYRTERNNGNLVFAMVDIDKFKSVNDNFGHPVGDKVIKSLARILKQSLRKSDTVGRYGGEEFAVILYDTDMKNALKIMDKIRVDFEAIAHKAGDIEFNITFSCGLAAFPYFTTAVELNEAADRALYLAKGDGRNKVVAADPLMD